MGGESEQTIRISLEGFLASEIAKEPLGPNDLQGPESYPRTRVEFARFSSTRSDANRRISAAPLEIF